MLAGIPWGIYAGSPADPKPSIQLVQPLQSHVGSMMTFSLNEVAIISPSTVVYTVRTKKGKLQAPALPQTFYYKNQNLDNPHSPCGDSSSNDDQDNETYESVPKTVSLSKLLDDFESNKPMKINSDLDVASTTDVQPKLKKIESDLKSYGWQLVLSIMHAAVSNMTVTSCVISQNQLWLGTESGQVLVYLVSMLQGKEELVANAPNHPLIGHSAPVSCMTVSYDFKVCFSGGEDGLVILWDSNRLSYIRSVAVSKIKIYILSVSETLGDWVSVTHTSASSAGSTPSSPTATASASADDRGSSVIRYYSINAEFIDSITINDARVTCVTFSNASEGRNVNVVVVGCSDRSIRFFSTWNLTLVRILKCDRIKESPIHEIGYVPHDHILTGGILKISNSIK
ncbi:Lysosomal-trafficking regulator [Armadillidium nasatum]|uniref:Lysosomal-trafficking regulator n=1 Tax=Armadillidium nasatum TaxID=96803 RepID=A0A5N5TCL7_9CRUS|nr:Lysosomal-trafficking regulator [Armadillidium nasatum]